MSYVRKTRDYWDIEQYTGPQYGWEVVHAEETWADTRRSLREYRENQPEYPVRARRKREHIHTLAIVSRHDAQAVCTCNGWRFVTVGLLTQEVKTRIEEEYQRHLQAI